MSVYLSICLSYTCSVLPLARLLFFLLIYVSVICIVFLVHTLNATLLVSE